MRAFLERNGAWVAAYIVLAIAALIWSHYFEAVRVVGGSMEPTLKDGDIVCVREDAEPRMGDVVLVRQPGRMAVLHRVVGEESQGRLRLRGDANTIDDLEPVAREHIEGTMTAVLPFGVIKRHWLQWRGCDTLTAQSNSGL